MLKHSYPWVLKAGLSIGLICYVLTRIDIANAYNRAKAVDFWMLAISVVLGLIQISISAMRWGVVLRALSGMLSAKLTLAVFYIGTFFTIVLPGAVGGDALRMWYSRRAGLSLATSINSVLLDRAVTVLGLVLLVTATQPLLTARIPNIPGTWVFPALSAVGVIGIFLLALLDRIPTSLHRWRLVRGLVLLAPDTRALFFRPRFVLSAMALTIVSHVVSALMVFVLALGLRLPIDAIDCIVLVPPVILIMTLPISISGWGVRETAMVAAFGFIGIPSESAFVVSVLYGIVCMVTSLPGALFLMINDKNIGD